MIYFENTIFQSTYLDRPHTKSFKSPAIDAIPSHEDYYVHLAKIDLFIVKIGENPPPENNI